MGIESFDGAVIAANALTCTPEVVMRAINNVNEAGAGVGPRRLPVLLLRLISFTACPAKPAVRATEPSLASADA